MLQLSMECWNSAFNAQGSRLIIVVVQLGAVKIDAAAVEALRRKERQDETQFSEFHPPLNSNVLFCRFFLNLTLCVTKLRVLMIKLGVLMLCFSYFTDNSINVPAIFQINRLTVSSRKCLHELCLEQVCNSFT
jgi:hypothetical protein